MLKRCVVLRCSQLKCGSTVWNRVFFRRDLSSNQLATALRPFYFAVHPDLFGKHPRERVEWNQLQSNSFIKEEQKMAINENSLKQLTAYLELVQQKRTVRPTKFTFYLRQPSAPVKTTRLGDANLKAVDIALPISHDIKIAVHHILKSCDISTSYLDSLPVSISKVERSSGVVWNRFHFYAKETSNVRDFGVKDVEHELFRKPIETLGSWLLKNNEIARRKLDATKPIREETDRLQYELCHQVGIKEILWSCGWGIAHFKGCLQSLESLRQHHPEVLKNLDGRTVVFGNMTGVNLDGHVILSSSDVRNSWLELIKSVKQEDITRQRIPAVELAVSCVLRDIKVVHRKFQPAIAANTYENHLRMLSASLADFWVKNGYPRSWPPSLNAFQLVVECHASPLMLTPTGQFIVPASCPAFLIANFFTENLAEANRRLLSYKQNKRDEIMLHDLCMKELELGALHKDDNVTPDRMIQCLQKLLNRKEQLGEVFKGTRLNVTHFYSVLEDGEMCLPWNWVE